MPWLWKAFRALDVTIYMSTCVFLRKRGAYQHKEGLENMPLALENSTTSTGLCSFKFFNAIQVSAMSIKRNVSFHLWGFIRNIFLHLELITHLSDISTTESSFLWSVIASNKTKINPLLSTLGSMFLAMTLDDHSLTCLLLNSKSNNNKFNIGLLWYDPSISCSGPTDLPITF